MAALVPAVSGMSTKEVEALALNIVKWHSPHCLHEPQRLDCIEIWERLGDDDSPYKGLSPKVEILPPGVEGRTWPDGRIILAQTTYEAALEGDGRARFTVMHEVMHAIRHIAQLRKMKGRFQSERGILLNRNDLKPYLDPEWQANAFASASLMPASMVLRVTHGLNRHTSIERVSNVFGVSRSAAEYRLNTIERYGLGRSQ